MEKNPSISSHISLHVPKGAAGCSIRVYCGSATDWEAAFPGLLHSALQHQVSRLQYFPRCHCKLLFHSICGQYGVLCFSNLAHQVSHLGSTRCFRIWHISPMCIPTRKKWFPLLLIFYLQTWKSTEKHNTLCGPPVNLVYFYRSVTFQFCFLKRWLLVCLTSFCSSVIFRRNAYKKYSKSDIKYFGLVPY